MPRLVCTFGRFISIIEANGFILHRQGATSHCRYRGTVGGQVRYVDVASHGDHDEIADGTLSSMIRQSGLPKKTFRKP